MAKQTINVDPAVLLTTATSIENLAAEYKKNYEQLFAEIEAMSANWQGKDNLAYTNQIKGFSDEFTAMYNLMNEFVEFLRDSSNLYTVTQNDRTDAARKLTN